MTRTPETREVSGLSGRSKLQMRAKDDIFAEKSKVRFHGESGNRNFDAGLPKLREWTSSGFELDKNNPVQRHDGG